MTPNRTWKQSERVIAKRLQGERVGVTGRASADVLSERFAVEVKCRRSFPRWLEDAYRQAEAGVGAGRMPLVVLHRIGTRHDRDYVLLSLADLERLMGSD